MKIAIGLHDVSSTSRLTDFLRTLFAFDLELDLVVFSRVTGAAAQYGLPEASKLLFKKGISFLVLQDINEYREVLGDYKIVQYSVSKGRPISSFDELNISLDSEKILFLFSGNDAGFSQAEIAEGAVAIKLQGVSKELPPESALSLVLYMLYEKKNP